MSLATHQSDPHQRARLRWRARRGLLENDLILTRFLERYEAQLTDAQVAALTCLLELSDNTLMDLILAHASIDHIVDPIDIDLPAHVTRESVQQILDILRAV